MSSKFKVNYFIIYFPNGVIIFNDTVLDKSYSFAIDGELRQYLGNVPSVIKGIGIVNCLYYNPEVANLTWTVEEEQYGKMDKVELRIIARVTKPIML